jgi:hypothetical protein
MEPQKLFAELNQKEGALCVYRREFAWPRKLPLARSPSAGLAV